MSTGVRLLGVAAELPAKIRSSAEAEALIAEHGGYKPRSGVIEALSGIRERRVADDDLQCSDLAVAACRKVLADTHMQPQQIDLLIFASAGQDLIEPATAHIVQAKLGTNCQVFDVKNACNSFLNGMQVAEALICNGACKTALVTVGEINSRVAHWGARNLQEFKQDFPGYTMGDAGAAMLLTRSDSERGIFLRCFTSASDHWDLTTVSSGGSMHPRGDEHTFLRARVAGLKDPFKKVGLPLLQRAMRDSGLIYHDFKRIFVHQVSVPYLLDTLEEGKIPPELIEQTIVEFGNMAAASIPVAMARALARGAIGPGDRILCLGLASGISFGIMMIEL